MKFILANELITQFERVIAEIGTPWRNESGAVSEMSPVQVRKESGGSKPMNLIYRTATVHATIPWDQDRNNRNNPAILTLVGYDGAIH
jgi:hypothetical protein